MHAKEKLGDENAEIIAQEYGVEKWNSSSLKGCCPFHHERNPSFSYDRKTYSAHCFACGRSTDAIQAMMDGEGLSFTKSVKRLFEKADMDIMWDGVKPDKAYAYPHEESDLTQDVIDYMDLRGISEQTLRKCGVQSDGEGNVVFPYRDEHDVLRLVKYRPARKITKGENKCWCQKNADTTPLLFNMHRCNPAYPLLICEGESDCLAAYEAGWHNVVSTPFGANNYQWIDQNYEWLDQFQEIIVAGDRDEPGQKMNREVIRRLGAYRTKYLEIPEYYYDDEKQKTYSIKDVNEILARFGPDVLIELINNAHETPIESIKDISDIDFASIDEFDGIKTGFASLDKEIGGLLKGSLTIITGTAGSGKTSLMYGILAQALESGESFWCFSGELPETQTASWLTSILAGPRHAQEMTASNGNAYYKTDWKAAQEIRKFYRGRWFVYKDDCEPDVDKLIDSATQTFKRYGTKCFLFDNLMMVSSENSDEELKQQKYIVTKLVEFARTYNVVCILVSHPRKLAQGNRVGLFDLSGSASQGNLAHRVISVRRVTDDDREGKSQYGNIPEDLRQYNVVVEIIKDRFGGKQSKIGLYYDVASRRFYSSPEELDRVYAWDKSVYDKPLAWPHGDPSEVIGTIERGS